MNTISLLYWLHPKRKKNLYLRITVNGVRAEISTGKQIDPKEWKGHGIYLDPSIRENRIRNRKFTETIERIENIIETLEDKSIYPGARLVKDVFLGVRTMPGEKLKIEILEAGDYFEKSNYKQIDQKWKKTCGIVWGRFCQFIYDTHQKPYFFDDLRKKALFQFVSHMESKGLKIASRTVYLSAVKNVIDTIREFYSEEILSPETDPTLGVKIKLNDAEKDSIEDNKIKHLSMDELKIVMAAKFEKDVREHVRKLFLLQCFTGMAYRELINFSPESHLITSIDNQQKLRFGRRKNRGSSGKMAEVPVFDETKALLKYFQGTHALYRDRAKDKFLYVPPSYSRFLADMAKDLKIQHISGHTGRRTFGYLMLSKGFSMDQVSAMLGHGSLLITQKSYAAISFEHLQNTMEKFEDARVVK